MTRGASLVVLLLLAVVPRPSAQQSTLAPNDLVGTWTLVSAEEGGTGGARVPNPRGLLIFDGAGHIFEAITRANRQQPAAEPDLTDQQHLRKVHGPLGPLPAG